ncbi:MAG: esterase FrsA [Chloroflexota bacterium]|nr:esterase FrsA [Chloroflexota bacterium]
MPATIPDALPAEAPDVYQYATQAGRFVTISGVAQPLAMRAMMWVRQCGADEDELLNSLRDPKHGPDPATAEWIAYFSAVGAAHSYRAAAAEQQSDTETARAEYLAAALYYEIAIFPHLFHPDAPAAYAKHRKAYLGASTYFDPPLEIVRVPFEGGELIGYLRVPRLSEGAPVVIVSGGIDGWKSHASVHQTADELLRHGLATLQLDGPGTGEAPIVAGPDAQRTYDSALQYLRTRPDIDGRRIGLHMRSFGGHWAVKLALTNPNVRAAVNVGGPLHHTFAPEWLATLPMPTIASLGKVMGVDVGTVGREAVAEALGTLSLVRQGVLEAQATGANLLSINGARDALIPLSDLTIISERGIPQDTLVYGTDIHTAPFNWGEHLPFSAAWLRRKLR